jgi:DNA-binding transcriptional ArsR family regulator
MFLSKLIWMVYNNKMTKLNQLGDFEPAQTILVSDLETLKVVSDTLRSRILDLLRAEPRTVKQLASTLALSPKKLYYHINLMEQHGLIRVVNTRFVSGIREKTYRATAYLFLFDNEVFAASKTDEQGLPLGTALLFETTKNQLAQSVADKLVDLADDAPPMRRLLVNWNMQRLTPAQAEAFYAKFVALLEEFGAGEGVAANEEAQAYRLFLTLFPVRWHAAAPGKEETGA